MGRLQGKTALITGAASGIGEATARLFVAEGASVVLVDIQDRKGWALAEELGPRAVYVHADVTSEEDVRSAVAETTRQFGRLDCLFNNAGHAGVRGTIEEISLDAFTATVHLLLTSVFLGMKHAAPIMKRQRSGSIISTASIAGLRAGWGPHVYSTAKAAVVHLTRSVATELGEQGVRVNCICPGSVATPIFGKAFGLSAERAADVVPVTRELLKDVQPIKRAGLPEDIAHAALWLASNDSTFVTGHALVVDGGCILGRQWSVSQQHDDEIKRAFGIFSGPL